MQNHAHAATVIPQHPILPAVTVAVPTTQRLVEGTTTTTTTKPILLHNFNMQNHAHAATVISQHPILPAVTVAVPTTQRLVEGTPSATKLVTKPTQVVTSVGGKSITKNGLSAANAIKATTTVATVATAANVTSSDISSVQSAKKDYSWIKKYIEVGVGNVTSTEYESLDGDAEEEKAVDFDEEKKLEIIHDRFSFHAASVARMNTTSLKVRKTGKMPLQLFDMDNSILVKFPDVGMKGDVKRKITEAHVTFTTKQSSQGWRFNVSGHRPTLSIYRLNQPYIRGSTAGLYLLAKKMDGRKFFDKTPVDTITLNQEQVEENGVLTFDVTEDVQRMIKGSLHNYGWMITKTIHAPDNKENISFFSESVVDRVHRGPKLSLEFDIQKVKST